MVPKTRGKGQKIINPLNSIFFMHGLREWQWFDFFQCILLVTGLVLLLRLMDHSCATEEVPCFWCHLLCSLSRTIPTCILEDSEVCLSNTNFTFLHLVYWLHMIDQIKD